MSLPCEFFHMYAAVGAAFVHYFKLIHIEFLAEIFFEKGQDNQYLSFTGSVITLDHIQFSAKGLYQVWVF